MTSSYHTFNSFERYSAIPYSIPLQRYARKVVRQLVPSSKHINTRSHIYRDFDIYFLISFAGATITEDFYHHNVDVQ